MQLTLLQYVQSILSSLDSDEVNSISDNTESLQVAEILRTCYFNIIARTHLPEHKQLLQLEGSDNVQQPVVMLIPNGIGKLDWIWYFNSNITATPPGTTPHGLNVDILPQPFWTTTSTTSNTIGTGFKTFTVQAGLAAAPGQGAVAAANIAGNSMAGSIVSYTGTTLVMQVFSTTGSGTFSNWTITSNPNFSTAPPGYQEVRILPVTDFLNLTTQFNPKDNDVQTMSFTDSSNNFPGTFTFYYKNDRQPFYCTVLSDFYVIFDSYDNSQDSTLQGAKTMAYGEVIPFWSMTDTFIPNLDEQQVPLLLNEAKSLAYFELKQGTHVKAEQEAKRQWSSVQKDKSKVDKPSYFDQLPNFGRQSRSSYAGLSYFKMRGWDRP